MVFYLGCLMLVLMASKSMANDYGRRGVRPYYGLNDYGWNDYGRNDYGRNDYGRNDFIRNDYGYQGRKPKHIPRRGSPFGANYAPGTYCV